MKHTYLAMLTLSLSAFGSAYGNITISNYAVDPALKTLLDAHSDEIDHKIKKVHNAGQWHGVWQFDWLPGYYVKYGLARIVGLEKIRKCLSTYDLDLLTTPDKRIYHIKGRPVEYSSRNYAIIVKAVEATDNPQPLSLEQVKQLCTVIHKADYIDMTSTNYIRTKDGKLCLIDTEGIFNRKKLIKGFLRMIGTGHNLNTNYSKAGLIHIFKEVKVLIQRDPQWAELALRYIPEQFKEQQKPYSWDYESYFYELFADI